MRVALIVEYEGSNYHGFQYQANDASIQEELETAVARLTGDRSRVSGAGRTDAGVHARGQVVAFDTTAAHPPETFVRGLNHHLPDDIAVKAAYRTGDDFDPRRMALSRVYRYTIDCGATRSPLSRRTAYHIGQVLSARRMRDAAAEFVGSHDFAGFAGVPAGAGSSTVRAVYRTRVSTKAKVVEFEVEGSAFLPHQVRRMAGALVEVGRGALSRRRLRAVVERDPGAAVAHSLPAHGLCLMRVTYRNFPPEDDGQDGT